MDETGKKNTHKKIKVTKKIKEKKNNPRRLT